MRIDFGCDIYLLVCSYVATTMIIYPFLELDVFKRFERCECAVSIGSFSAMKKCIYAQL